MSIMSTGWGIALTQWCQRIFTAREASPAVVNITTTSKVHRTPSPQLCNIRTCVTLSSLATITARSVSKKIPSTRRIYKSQKDLCRTRWRKFQRMSRIQDKASQTYKKRVPNNSQGAVTCTTAAITINSIWTSRQFQSKFKEKCSTTLGLRSTMNNTWPVTKTACTRKDCPKRLSK